MRTRQSADRCRFDRFRHDRTIPDADAIRERGDIAVRNAKRGYEQSFAFENRGGRLAANINDGDLEFGAATGGTSECRAEHPEHAGLLIEELLKERSKVRNIRVPGRARDGKRGLAQEIAPQQGRQVGNMIRMEMADGDQGEVFEPTASLTKPEERASPRVNEDPTSSIDPNQVAGRRPIRADAWAVGAQYL